MEFTRIPTPEEAASEEGFDPAVRWFAKRLGMTRAQVDQMTLDARRKVFFVTGLSDLELIKSVQDSLARALEEGKTFEEWKAEVKEKKLFQGPEFTKRRLETIFRTNMQNAFATGRYMEMTSLAMLKRRPYWKFSAVRDGRTTSSCAAAHGVILRHDHPWWKTHIPPLHFNCRSTIVPLSERRAKELGITQNPPPAVGALGFGNPPDGVPVSSKDMPTESERKKREAAAAEVRDKIEAAKAASADATKAKRAVTAAKNERKAAEKALQKANGRQVPPAADRVFKAKRQEEAAIKRAEAKQKEKVRAEQAARKATAQGVPRNWEPTEKEVKRRFGSHGDEYIEMMRALKTAKPTKKDGRPAFELTTPNGGSIIIQEGDLIREKLEEYIRAKKIEKEVITGISPSENREVPIASEPAANKNGQKQKKLDEKKWNHIPRNIRENTQLISQRFCFDLLSKPETILETLMNTNSNYSSGLAKFRFNCQRCVAAFEARIRGLDVEAKPLCALDDPLSSWPTIAKAYKDGEKHAKWFEKFSDLSALIKKLLDVVKSAPDGARFTVVLAWKDGKNHALNVYNEKGVPKFIDTQVCDVKKQGRIPAYFNHVNLDKGFGIIRTDNLEFSDNVSEYITRRGAGKVETK